MNSPTVTITASIFLTTRSSTSVSVEFADPSASRGSWSTLLHFRRAGYKARAEQYLALVGREYASPVAAVRALAAAELEAMPSVGVGLQFVDSLLGLAD